MADFRWVGKIPVFLFKYLKKLNLQLFIVKSYDYEKSDVKSLQPSPYHSINSVSNTVYLKRITNSLSYPQYLVHNRPYTKASIQV
jgi:hypothetical protein